ncbi:unnamed protein product [Lota lota]
MPSFPKLNLQAPRRSNRCFPSLMVMIILFLITMSPELRDEDESHFMLAAPRQGFAHERGFAGPVQQKGTAGEVDPRQPEPAGRAQAITPGIDFRRWRMSGRQRGYHHHLHIKTLIAQNGRRPNISRRVYSDPKPLTLKDIEEKLPRARGKEPLEGTHKRDPSFKGHLGRG